MRKLLFLFLLSSLALPVKAQEVQQSILALRSEEHTKVEFVDSVVVFNDHMDSLKQIDNYNYFALELAEGLYRQMSDKAFTNHFNAIFAKGFTYRNVIESKDGTEIVIDASSKHIEVKIANHLGKEIAKEHFEF